MAENVVAASKFVIKDTLYEEIYDRITKTAHFLGFDGKDLTPKLRFFRNNETEYKPISSGLLEKNAVLLPSGVIEYESVVKLQAEINAFIFRYLDISEEHRKYATWYILISWVTDNLNTIPYLRSLGDYGAGKTRYLDTIGGLCYKPIFVGGAVRSAPIFRIIDRWNGTIVLDEFNLEKSDDAEEIVQILNNGYQRGKPIIRCEGNDFEPTAFDAFGPKIISTRKSFEDKALESRCITEILVDTTRDDIPVELPPEFFEEQEMLRNKLLLYRFRNWRIVGKEPITIKLDHVQPRIKQSMFPFAALFYQDPFALEKFKEEVIARNNRIVVENSNTLEGFIVRAYLSLVTSSKRIITVKDLIECIKEELDYEGNITERSVGTRLRSLGFQNKPVYDSEERKTVRIVKTTPSKLDNLRYKYVPESLSTGGEL